jgi:hypothetical protein
VLSALVVLNTYVVNPLLPNLIVQAIWNFGSGVGLGWLFFRSENR